MSLEGVFIIDSVGDSGGEGLGAQVVGWLNSEVIMAVDPTQGQVAVVGAVDGGEEKGLEIMIEREKEAGSCHGWHSSNLRVKAAQVVGDSSIVAVIDTNSSADIGICRENGVG